MFLCTRMSPTLEYKVLEGALCWSPHTPPLARHLTRRRPAANTCAGRGHAQGSKQGRVKAALGRASTAEGHRRETARCEARWAQGAGGRVPLYLREPQVRRPGSFTHSFIQPLLYGTGSTTGRWAGGTGQGAGDREGTGEGGPAVTGRDGSPERRFLEECTFSWWQKLAGASSLFPAPHAEAFPSLHEDLFTAPKTADTD